MSVAADKIQAIRERTDIVQLIGGYVSLKKSGRNHVGLCPFHGEKSPSFSVSQSKRLYYCFGCHAGGDAIDFVMRHSGVDFHTAVRQLAQGAGVEIEPESPAQKNRREAQSRIDRTNRKALEFFTHALWAESGAPARRYLGERRIPAVFAKERSLGYGGVDAAFRRFMREHACDEAALQEAGLVSEEGRWGLFQNRVIFPIFDLEGRLAGFGGRRLGDASPAEGHSPKYVNSRDSLLFSKRTLLYGLFDAQSSIRRQKRVVIVEGYTDVLASQRAGVLEAVAALGTAFTGEHAQMLKRLANTAIVLLDADAAGQRAAREAAAKLLGAGFTTQVGCLPAGEDPDSLVHAQGPEALQKVVEAARPALEHFIEAAFANAASIEERAEAARSVQPLLAALPAGLERDLYTGRLAERVGVPAESLKRHLQITKPKPAPRPTRDPFADPGPAFAGPNNYDAPPPAFDDASFSVLPGLDDAMPVRQSSPQRPERFSPGLESELGMVRELLLFPQLRARFGELAEYMLHDVSRNLTEALADPDAHIDEAIQKHIRQAIWVQRLCHREALEEAPLDEVNRQSNRTFDDVLARLKWRHVDAALTDVLRELRDVEARGEATDELMRRKQELTTRKRALHAGRTARSIK